MLGTIQQRAVYWRLFTEVTHLYIDHNSPKSETETTADPLSGKSSVSNKCVIGVTVPTTAPGLTKKSCEGNNI